MPVIVVLPKCVAPSHPDFLVPASSDFGYEFDLDIKEEMKKTTLRDASLTATLHCYLLKAY